jgi:hypothetical protein
MCHTVGKFLDLIVDCQLLKEDLQPRRMLIGVMCVKGRKRIQGVCVLINFILGISRHIL